MNNTIQKKLTPLIILLFSASLLTVGTLWTSTAEAHKGHAGKKITFLKKKVALKAMLPTDAKVYRRKQGLNDDQVSWAKKTYNVDLKSNTLAFYVSKNKTTKEQVGSAIIYKFTYRHGNCEVVLGLDKDNKVVKVAFYSVNEKYLVDFEETVGTGYLNGFDGMSISDLVKNAEKKSSSDKATREFSNALRNAAVTLAAFQQ